MFLKFQEQNETTRTCHAITTYVVLPNCLSLILLFVIASVRKIYKQLDWNIIVQSNAVLHCKSNDRVKQLQTIQDHD